MRGLRSLLVGEFGGPRSHLAADSREPVTRNVSKGDELSTGITTLSPHHAIAPSHHQSIASSRICTIIPSCHYGTVVPLRNGSMETIIPSRHHNIASLHYYPIMPLRYRVITPLSHCAIDPWKPLSHHAITTLRHYTSIPSCHHANALSRH